MFLRYWNQPEATRQKFVNDWLLTGPVNLILRPGFTIEAKNSPWLRLNWWATGLEGANLPARGGFAQNPVYAGADGLGNAASAVFHHKADDDLRLGGHPHP